MNLINKKVLKFFPQPIFHYKVENFKKHNENLSEYIYELYENDKNGLIRSNQGGWHSKPFDLKKKDKPPYNFFMEIQKYVADVFREYGWFYTPKKVNLTEMWAIINKKNNFNIEHTHPNNYLSAAYYVKAPENCGSFNVSNPNQVAKERIAISERVYVIKSLPLTLMLLPSPSSGGLADPISFFILSAVVSPIANL